MRVARLSKSFDGLRAVEDVSFVARAGHPCGADFLAEPFLDHHPEYSWQKPLLRDMKAGQWTVFTLPFDDGDMSAITSPTHRRSGRAFHKMRVQAQGRAHNGKKFKEACETVVVNGHGGLLSLKHEIDTNIAQVQ